MKKKKKNIRKGEVNRSFFFLLINATDAIEITVRILSIKIKGEKKLICEQLLTCKFIDIQ
jgi:hypothetical protein